MILYDYFRSSAAYRVRIALNLKQLPYEQRSVNLVLGEETHPSYTDLNHQALVPTLLVKNTVADASDICLTQSLSICEYLDEQHPQPALLPAEPLLRAEVRAFSQAIACDIHPLNNLRALKFLTAELGLSEDNKLHWYRHWVELGFRALETQLAARVQRQSDTDDFCFGGAPSLADICLVPQIFNAQRFEVPLQDYPHLMRIHSNCEKIDAFANAHPSRQPDTPSST